MTTTSALYDRLLDALLGLAWRQWTAAGVAGAQASAGTIVDPEALLLATLDVGRSDARLFDEVLDWIVRNSESLDMSRLRRLGRAATADQRRLLGVAAQVARGAGVRGSLRRLPDEEFVVREAAAPYAAEPLFRAQGHGEEQWYETDGLFAAVGYVRPPVVLRGLSQRPDRTNPACLRFRARALVGIGPRAEVLAYLWTHEWAHGRLIAERAVYGQAPVAEYLMKLADGGLAERRADGRRTLYRVSEALARVGSPAPLYVDWARGWPALIAVLDALRPAELSEDAAWMRLAETFRTRETGLRAEGLGIEVGDLRGWARLGSQVLVASAEAVIGRIQALAE